jgi:hypothetical protein
MPDQSDCSTSGTKLRGTWISWGANGCLTLPRLFTAPSSLQVACLDPPKAQLNCLKLLSPAKTYPDPPQHNPPRHIYYLVASGPTVSPLQGPEGQRVPHQYLTMGQGTDSCAENVTFEGNDLCNVVGLLGGWLGRRGMVTSEDREEVASRRRRRRQ